MTISSLLLGHCFSLLLGHSFSFTGSLFLFYWVTVSLFFTGSPVPLFYWVTISSLLLGHCFSFTGSPVPFTGSPSLFYWATVSLLLGHHFLSFTGSQFLSLLLVTSSSLLLGHCFSPSHLATAQSYRKSHTM